LFIFSRSQTPFFEIITNIFVRIFLRQPWPPFHVLGMPVRKYRLYQSNIYHYSLALAFDAQAIITGKTNRQTGHNNITIVDFGLDFLPN